MMKRMLLWMLSVMMCFSLITLNEKIAIKAQANDDIKEVTTWEEFKEAFVSDDPYTGDTFTIKLMNDLSGSAADTLRSAHSFMEVNVEGCHVTFDFNGHKLSFIDNVSSTDIQYQLSDFITINMYAYSFSHKGSTMRFVDSVGGGGISMNSSRGIDNQIAALNIESNPYYFAYGVVEGDTSVQLYRQFSSEVVNKVIFDGGIYKLHSKIEKFERGTLNFENWYRATVVASETLVEINDGEFYAYGDGVKDSYGDMGDRELSAFATATNENFNRTAIGDKAIQNQTIINGGLFYSEGYSIHHFDNATATNETHDMNFPTINGGIFGGKIAYVGMTFYYNDGNELYKDLSAKDYLFKNVSDIVMITEDNEFISDISTLTLGELHGDVKSCYVISDDFINFSTNLDQEQPIIKSSKVQETIEMDYKIPTWFKTLGNYEYIENIKIERKRSNLTPIEVNASSYDIDYSDYQNGCIITMSVTIKMGIREFVVSRSYDIDVENIYTISDACTNCHIEPVNGSFEVIEGESFSFTIVPDDFYEIRKDKAFYVFANENGIDPVNDVYTIENVRKDYEISTLGLQGYAMLHIDCGEEVGEVITLKKYVGESYVLPTIEELGYELPQGYELDNYTISTTTKKGEAGQTYGIRLAQDIYIKANYKGHHKINMINAKAYADEACSKEITYATKGQTVYVRGISDDGNQKFSYWKKEPSDLSITDNEVTSFEMVDKEVSLEAIYDQVVTKVMIHDLTYPSANEQLSSKHKGKILSLQGYTLGYSLWNHHENQKEMKDEEVFENNKQYEYVAFISLKEGYTFNDLNKVEVVLDGIDASKYQVISKELVNTTSLKVKVLITLGNVTKMNFVDVKEGAWFYGSVESAYQKGLMSNTGKGKQYFEPDTPISRGMVATVLYRMAAQPKVEFKATFSDVTNPKLWYSTAITWASQAGVVSGYKDGRFGPDDNITRQDLAIMLRNYAKKCGIDTSQVGNLTSFLDDEKVDSYAKSAVAWCVKAKLMSGSKTDAGSKLNPKNNASRAECAKMFSLLDDMINQ